MASTLLTTTTTTTTVNGSGGGGDAEPVPQPIDIAPTTKNKLHGRAFYESIGSPKYVVAPMVDQSEYAWRMLTRSFLPPSQRRTILAYTPMFHARLFAETPKYRDQHFQPLLGLDGNPASDRPLFVQFCANDPDHLLAAAKLVAPYCDAVDLNLGCPQGIAKKGRYGAFLQEDQELVYRLINRLHTELDIPVTAKIRILGTREETLAYARNVLSAGASILTVHGRRREQKGHLTGLADWEVIKWLRGMLPRETVMFSNGNVLEYGDLERCREATGVDAVMSAEGNLSNPGIFAEGPAEGEEDQRVYWKGRDGKGGWRVDETFRRYFDIVYKSVGRTPPERRRLFVPGDDESWLQEEEEAQPARPNGGEPQPKKKKKDDSQRRPEFDELARSSPNVSYMQPHLFHLLRHFVSVHTDVRDALARARAGDLEAYERILGMVERRVARGLIEHERTGGESIASYLEVEDAPEGIPEGESSVPARRRCKRPWWVVQPIIRPLPAEAMLKGAVREKGKKQKEKKGGQEGKSVVGEVVSQANREVKGEESVPVVVETAEGTNGERKRKFSGDGVAT
ncbi:dihydrouridine synthase [Echria macrotheca]|uniref:tRNA-dihydrouridine(16/17) synthase [NAD(P)(+)] n=1 Tax=Echria macrotheca TaxID=438768 RepID=A0AAJ0B6Q6_9PEZI|nr:dihydrouridine synthase [Echria macrotheca]